jgi:hypothetical protein
VAFNHCYRGWKQLPVPVRLSKIGTLNKFNDNTSFSERIPAILVESDPRQGSDERNHNSDFDLPIFLKIKAWNGIRIL